MPVDIEIPKHLPAITLPGTILFPQVILPLHIFEDRYREMIKDVLARDRIFAVLTLREDEEGSEEFLCPEPPYPVASAGMVRACQDMENGTSNIILQGLCRIQVEDILSEVPYRTIAIRPLLSEPLPDADTGEQLRLQLLNCLHRRRRLGSPVTKEMMNFLKNLREPEVVADVVAFSLCENLGEKYRLLKTLPVETRLRQLIAINEKEITRLHLQKKLQGDLPDNDIPRN